MNIDLHSNLTPINDEIIHRADTPSRGGLAFMDNNEYFLRRANEELAAAERATSAAARYVHTELANRYLKIIAENGSPVLESPAPASEGRLSARRLQQA